MAFLRVFFVAACLQAAFAFPAYPNCGPPPCAQYAPQPCAPQPCAPPPCAPPQPRVQVIEKPVPYPVVEEVQVPVPAPVPVPVVAPTITETTTRLASTTSGNGAEQRVITTSAPAPPVGLPLPTPPVAPPCGAPLAGAELILNANAPALALGASPLALNNGYAYNGLLGAPAVNEIVAPGLAYGSPALGALELALGAPGLAMGAPGLAYGAPGLAYGSPALGALELALGAPPCGQSPNELLNMASLYNMNGFALPAGNPLYC